MYQVLARKWRPRGFDELVGQEHVARTLRNSIEAGRTAHAYIFAGLRGTGKTTVARILAKCLNCEKGPTPTPCGVCVPCQEITDGRALDVLEMDAASRTGVDDIRELQEVVSYAPARDRNRILIIDEAHMLSKSAFNALLKTLEEPPPRVVFVLATTELQKILPTILSRCQLFEFRRVTPRELAAHLRTVCKTEKVRISDAVLDRIARAGEGSVRDSLSLLERVLAFGGENVSEEDALTVLGAVRTEVLVGLVRGLASRDAASMLTVLDGLVAEGHDLLHVWAELVGVLRDLMMLRTLPGRADLLSRSPEEASALEAAASTLSRQDLTRAFQILAELEFGLKSSGQPRFLFEAGLMRLADIGSVRPIEEALESLGRGESPARPRPVAAAPTPPPASPQKKKHAESGSADALLTFRTLLHGTKPMLDAILEQASAMTLESGVLSLTFPPRLETLRQQVEKPENLLALKTAATQAAGAPVEVRVRSTGKSEEYAEAPSEPDVASAPRPDPTGPGPVLLLESARKEPGVARLLLEFGAQIVDIRGLDAPVSLDDRANEESP